MTNAQLYLISLKSTEFLGFPQLLVECIPCLFDHTNKEKNMETSLVMKLQLQKANSLFTCHSCFSPAILGCGNSGKWLSRNPINFSAAEYTAGIFHLSLFPNFKSRCQFYRFSLHKQFIQAHLILTSKFQLIITSFELREDSISRFSMHQAVSTSKNVNICLRCNVNQFINKSGCSETYHHRAKKV